MPWFIFHRSIKIEVSRKEKYPPAISTAFFENLLPENNARAILSFNLRFDKKDTFAFLENFGEDCAGALSIIPEGSKTDFNPDQYECINTELLETLDKIMAAPGQYTSCPELFLKSENKQIIDYQNY